MKLMLMMVAILGAWIVLHLVLIALALRAQRRAKLRRYSNRRWRLP